MVAAVEVLRRTPRVSKLIWKGEFEALQEEIETSVSYHKMQSMNQSLAALVLHGTITKETALARSSNPADLDLCLRKFLFADVGKREEDDPMAECTSDYSKILELQEIKKLYDELQERHLQEVAERDREIAALREQVAAGVPAPAADPKTDHLARENQRLAKQLQLVRVDYEGKLDRLNARLRDLSGKGMVETPAAETGERRGFFRR
jgi:hypothetical protein